nr:spore cortex-lytic enzyme [Salsuginibacillus halophilus]
MLQTTVRLIIICSGVICLSFPAATVDAFSEQTIQRGATGDDVVELQARLQYNGYYEGTIDGVYGWGTYWAVRNFQEAFGLEVDGLVGNEMKDRLVEATSYDEAFVQRMLQEGRSFTHYGGTPLENQKGPAPDTGSGGTGESAPPAEGDQSPPEGEGDEGEPPDTGGNEAADEEVTEEDGEADIHQAMNVPDGFSDNDIQMLANAVHGEARGEPYTGQVAVAAVIINRMNSDEFPDTVNGVVFEPLAFEAVMDGQIWLEPNEESRQAVLDAINGQDPTGGALYFFNPETAESDWIWSRPQIKQIGKHIFAE